MKKFGFLIFLGVLAIGLVAAIASPFGKLGSGNFEFHFGGVKGSGNVVTDKRDIDSFHGIEVGNAIQVDIVAQKDYSLEIEADDNIVPLIRTEVSGGILQISCEKSISKASPIHIRISAPNIDSLDVSGASNVTVAGLQNSSLSVESSGASKVRIDGTTTKLTVDISGASKVDAQNLTAETGSIETSGASSANVNVTSSLRADASGASHINYSGSPKDVIKKSSGASSVSGQ
jgi:hypothetical protein